MVTYKLAELGDRIFHKSEIASFDVDPQNCFTPLCMGELPVPRGDEIVDELNKQAEIGDWRVGSKDAHSMSSLWVDTDQMPQFTPIQGYEDLDVRWRLHGVPGTFGFQLVKGLPSITEYDYFVWKGIETNIHPYGACYHDLKLHPSKKRRMSTGVIEFFKINGITVVIVGGLATDYCVYQTVLQLQEAGFIVILNLGACRGIAEDTTKKAIDQMKAAGAIIVNSASEIVIEGVTA
ncbi:MAG: isochorismatase family protein [bacterium]|nr:isochorismatase family protein [bacterium]